METHVKSMRRKKESNDPNLFLRKHVGLIHCENKLTLIQRKICNILLFNALDKINDQEIFEISLRQLCSLVGYNSNDTKLIKSAIKSLIAVVMEWNLLDDNKFVDETQYPEEMVTWHASSLLAGASIRSGLIQYSYSPQMKSVLSSLEIYGRINLFVQAKFNSTYSLVLYENCVRFKNIKQTAWFPIELFRTLMGVSEGKYISFKEFNRNVITAAVNEINLKSDIYIEPQFKRTGRRITSIQFILSENKNYQPSFKKITAKPVLTLETAKQQSTLLEILMSEFELSEKQATQLEAQYAPDYLLEKINFVKRKRHIEHRGAYLVSALKKDYKSAPAAPNKVVKINSYLREAKEASEITSLKNKYMLYKLKEYQRFITEQPNTMQNMIHAAFEAFIKPNAEIFRFYKKKKLTSPFVMTEFMGFIDLHYPQVLGAYLNFEEYLTSEEVS